MSNIFKDTDIELLSLIDDQGIDKEFVKQSIDSLAEQSSKITKPQRQLVRGLLHQTDTSLSDFNLTEETFKAMTITEGSAFIDELLILKEEIIEEDIDEEFYAEGGSFEWS